MLGVLATCHSGVINIVRTAHDPAVQYGFAYNVQDLNTGDSKSRQETRDGDVVRGLCIFIFSKCSTVFAEIFEKSFCMRNKNC